MAVTSCIETTGRSAESVAQYAGDDDRTWVVQCSNATDDRYTIEAAGVLPLHGSSHPRNFQSSLRAFSFDDSNGPYTWNVKAKYSTRNETRSEQDRRQIPVPWYRPAIISCVASERQEELAIDAAGFAILNSAYDPFKPGPSVSRFSASVFVRKATPAVPSWFFSLPGYTNNADVSITLPTGSFPTAAAGTLLFVPKELTEIKYEGPDNIYAYQEVSFELRYDPDKWQYKPLDEGYHYYDGGVRKTFVVDGVAVVGLLDGASGKLALPTPPAPPPAGVFFDGIGTNPSAYERYKRADFSVLPLT